MPLACAVTDSRSAIPASDSAKPNSNTSPGTNRPFASSDGKQVTDPCSYRRSSQTDW